MEAEGNKELGSIRRLTQHRDAPTLPREAQRNAEALLACRKEELVSVQRDIDVLLYMPFRDKPPTIPAFDPCLHGKHCPARKSCPHMHPFADDASGAMVSDWHNNGECPDGVYCKNEKTCGKLHSKSTVRVCAAGSRCGQPEGCKRGHHPPVALDEAEANGHIVVLDCTECNGPDVSHLALTNISTVVLINTSQFRAVPDEFLAGAPKLEVVDLSACAELQRIGSDFCAGSSVQRVVLPLGKRVPFDIYPNFLRDTPRLEAVDFSCAGSIGRECLTNSGVRRIKLPVVFTYPGLLLHGCEKLKHVAYDDHDVVAKAMRVHVLEAVGDSGADPEILTDLFTWMYKARAADVVNMLLNLLIAEGDFDVLRNVLNASKMKSLVLNTDATSLPDNMLRGVDSLRTVDLSLCRNLTSIGRYFAAESSVTTIVFSANIARVGRGLLARGRDGSAGVALSGLSPRAIRWFFDDKQPQGSDVDDVRKMQRGLIERMMSWEMTQQCVLAFLCELARDSPRACVDLLEETKFALRRGKWRCAGTFKWAAVPSATLAFLKNERDDVPLLLPTKDAANDRMLWLPVLGLTPDRAALDAKYVVTGSSFHGFSPLHLACAFGGDVEPMLQVLETAPAEWVDRLPLRSTNDVFDRDPEVQVHRCEEIGEWTPMLLALVHAQYGTAAQLCAKAKPNLVEPRKIGRQVRVSPYELTLKLWREWNAASEPTNVERECEFSIIAAEMDVQAVYRTLVSVVTAQDASVLQFAAWLEAQILRVEAFAHDRLVTSELVAEAKALWISAARQLAPGVGEAGSPSHRWFDRHISNSASSEKVPLRRWLTEWLLDGGMNNTDGSPLVHIMHQVAQHCEDKSSKAPGDVAVVSWSSFEVQGDAVSLERCDEIASQTSAPFAAPEIRRSATAPIAAIPDAATPWIWSVGVIIVEMLALVRPTTCSTPAWSIADEVDTARNLERHDEKDFDAIGRAWQGAANAVLQMLRFERHNQSLLLLAWAATQALRVDPAERQTDAAFVHMLRGGTLPPGALVVLAPREDANDEARAVEQATVECFINDAGGRAWLLAVVKYARSPDPQILLEACNCIRARGITMRAHTQAAAKELTPFVDSVGGDSDRDTLCLVLRAIDATGPARSHIWKTVRAVVVQQDVDAACVDFFLKDENKKHLGKLIEELTPWRKAEFSHKRTLVAVAQRLWDGKVPEHVCQALLCELSRQDPAEELGKVAWAVLNEARMAGRTSALALTRYYLTAVNHDTHPLALQVQEAKQTQQAEQGCETYVENLLATCERLHTRAERSGQHHVGSEHHAPKLHVAELRALAERMECDPDVVASYDTVIPPLAATRLSFLVLFSVLLMFEMLVLGFPQSVTSTALVEEQITSCLNPYTTRPYGLYLALQLKNRTYRSAAHNEQLWQLRSTLQQLGAPSQLLPGGATVGSLLALADGCASTAPLTAAAAWSQLQIAIQRVFDATDCGWTRTMPSFAQTRPCARSDLVSNASCASCALFAELLRQTRAVDAPFVTPFVCTVAVTQAMVMRRNVRGVVENVTLTLHAQPTNGSLEHEVTTAQMSRPVSVFFATTSQYTGPFRRDKWTSLIATEAQFGDGDPAQVAFRHRVVPIVASSRRAVAIAALSCLAVVNLLALLWELGGIVLPTTTKTALKAMTLFDRVLRTVQVVAQAAIIALTVAIIALLSSGEIRVDNDEDGIRNAGRWHDTSMVNRFAKIQLLSELTRSLCIPPVVGVASLFPRGRILRLLGLVFACGSMMMTVGIAVFAESYRISGIASTRIVGAHLLESLPAVAALVVLFVANSRLHANTVDDAMRQAFVDGWTYANTLGQTRLRVHIATAWCILVILGFFVCLLVVIAVPLTADIPDTLVLRDAHSESPATPAAARLASLLALQHG